MENEEIISFDIIEDGEDIGVDISYYISENEKRETFIGNIKRYGINFHAYDLERLKDKGIILTQKYLDFYKR